MIRSSKEIGDQHDAPGKSVMLGDDVETVWSFNGDCPIAFA
jgi:hypothetical protein